MIKMPFDIDCTLEVFGDLVEMKYKIKELSDYSTTSEIDEKLFLDAEKAIDKIIVAMVVQTVKDSKER